MPSVLLVGCGDIALRLAPLLEPGATLSGLRRHPENLPSFIRPIQADVCDAVAMANALEGHLFDYVIVTLTPGERSESRYRQVYVEGMRCLLQSLPGRPRVLFVSSTSVFGQHHGEWVNEHSVAEGDGFSGRVLREAEQLLMASGLPATCIRFSGIYGPGRERLIRLVREGRVALDNARQYSNRIHADDAARVLAFLIDRWEKGQPPAPVYVASDPQPVQSGNVWLWMATRMGVTGPALEPLWDSEPATGKRCDSALLQSQGFVFQYPDFCAGYAALM